ncbi:MAG TPA: UDP-N-acetylmuramoyl-L-alanyl-D-glutamate--2,6-diaminopimelate ligase [Gammaproteobacteria bacterium]|nr:UDP-N-acetylmuramoyl-L-alanyl-D-glutamate--2,6-diaminopimelate ligase [Gammaproteobacteria bacterium]
MMTASDYRSDIPSGHKLSELLAGLAVVEAACERDIGGLSIDSRTTQPGDLFLACPGSHAHGQNFIEAAIQAGAVAVVWEADPLFPGSPAACTGPAVPMFGIEGLRQKVGVIADRFYQHPSQALCVTGITGTNGKTSVSHFIAQALSPNCGLIGTLGSGVYGNLRPGTHTTPDAVTLHATLNDLRQRGVRQVVMEASSHGLEQGRVSGVQFNLAVFTNLSRDHLDYHGTMEAYAEAKRHLLLSPGLRYAVINADDSYGRELLAALPAGVQALSYGFTAAALGSVPAVRGSNLQLSAGGVELDVNTPWGDGHLHSSLLGRFNASNLLAALAVLLLLEIPFAEALERIARSRTLPGRMECFGGAGQPLVVVDYAHTPDALEQVLYALREHLACGARLWCVFGCGGERDRGKRPLMGAAAEEFADYVVVTDDNPRHEDPLAIITDILSGMTNPDGVYIQRVRAQAIAFAITYARPGDIVLIAGKGHEEYQQVGDQRLPFSDRQQVYELLNKAGQ